MKTKDEVLSLFRELKAHVENKIEKNIKVLRSDNWGKYTSNDFKYFYKEAGIKREFTVPYNPQQNGIVDRKNRSIISSVKAMIHDQGLPMFILAEACNTSMYFQNRNPHKILGDKTPKEAFTGVKPEIGHLRIIGCPVYIHVPMEKRMKLEPLELKGIFVGYNETLKAYRIIIPVRRKIFVSRDVKFEDNLASRKSQDLSPVTDNEEKEAPKDEHRSVASS